MKKLNKEQQGFASIVVALTMIIVLALLVVGFSQLSRREQQNALNKQLSSQAYYAAETGINDTRKLIKDGTITESTSNVGTDRCLDLRAITGEEIQTVDSASGVSYSCVTADLSPKSLQYSNVAADTSQYASFQVARDDGTLDSLSSLTISWQTNNANSDPSSDSLLWRANWRSNRYPSVIQFSLTPYDKSNTSRDALINGTFSTLLFPHNLGSGSVSYSTAANSQTKLAKATCGGSPYTCKLTITGIPSSPNSYLMHFTNIYETSSLTISGRLSNGEQANFKNAQAVIDVTGKARNVLKRLRVALPLNQMPTLPGYALEGQDICKRIQTDPAETTFDSPSGSDGCILDSTIN